MYQLPEHIGRQVTEQYERDVARVHGGPVVHEEAEIKKFMAGLGGAPPPELMGIDGNGEQNIRAPAQLLCGRHGAQQAAGPSCRRAGRRGRNRERKQGAICVCVVFGWGGGMFEVSSLFGGVSRGSGASNTGH